MDQAAHRVLFAGGCQVEGFPVGKEMGFVECCRRLLRARGIEIQPTAIGYVNLKHAYKLKREIDRIQPALVVLQVGHWELFSAVSKTTSVQSDSAGQRSHPAISTDPSPFRTRISRCMWRLKQVLKAIRHFCGGGVPNNPVEFAPKLEDFLREVRAHTDLPLVALSPLPCADWVLNRVRRDTIPFYKELCAKYNVHFLDVLSANRKDFSRYRLHYDTIHLGVQGHHRLAVMVANTLFALARTFAVKSAADSHIHGSAPSSR